MWMPARRVRGKRKVGTGVWGRARAGKRSNQRLGQVNEISGKRFIRLQEASLAGPHVSTAKMASFKLYAYVHTWASIYHVRPRLARSHGLHAHRVHRPSTYMTRLERESTFNQLPAFNSMGTGPCTLLPKGFRSGPRRTTAFSSKRRVRPSGRANPCRHRTTRALCTSPGRTFKVAPLRTSLMVTLMSLPTLA